MAGKKTAKPRGMKRAAATAAVNSSLKLGREFYDQPCIQLAQALLGKVLVRRLPQTGEILRGTIVETEAYPGGKDEASGSFNIRRTERTEAMFMDPGTAFVYLTYGMYRMMNISSQGEGSACLLRGIEPHEDYPSMHELRMFKKPRKDGKVTAADKGKKKALKVYELANGPGKLCTAFGVTLKEHNKMDLSTSDDLWLEDNPDPKFQPGNFNVEIGKRVGIDSASPTLRDQPWRWFVQDNFSVSTAKPSQIRKKLEAEVAAMDKASSSE